MRWNSLSQPESENAGGERSLEIKLETDKFWGFKVEYCKFTTEIHGFHSIQSEIHINTK